MRKRERETIETDRKSKRERAKNFFEKGKWENIS